MEPRASIRDECEHFLEISRECFMYGLHGREKAGGWFVWSSSKDLEHCWHYCLHINDLYSLEDCIGVTAGQVCYDQGHWDGQGALNRKISRDDNVAKLAWIFINHKTALLQKEEP